MKYVFLLSVHFLYVYKKVENYLYHSGKVRDNGPTIIVFTEDIKHVEKFEHFLVGVLFFLLFLRLNGRVVLLLATYGIPLFLSFYIWFVG